MKKQLNKKYQPQLFETNKYQFWKQNNFFSSSKKATFSIVLPPPNVTGKLHLGHAWDGTLQDILIRYKKLQGYETLFLPGMDHAGIATQSKVEERLRVEQKILRHDLGRKNLIEQIWKWKDEYADIIRSQWSKLGLALDYKYDQFTLNENFSKAVNYVFTSLYQKKIIYRGKKIIPWDPVQQTALSNIEVNYQEVQGKMYYFKYFLANSKTDFLTIATTRPETMFADQAVIVNPKDERFRKYWNTKVINPVNGEEIPVLADEYVDINFGTGVMKCTPAHDFNDFEIGVRHHLAFAQCMNWNGTMNELAGKWNNIDRFTTREQLVTQLQEQNLVLKIEDYIHQVGFSERSNTVIEPMLSTQWFIKMQSFAQQIIKNQASNKKVNFFPERFNDALLTWMDNIQDWCISRQLWWGHQIPAWYHKKTNEIYVGENPPANINEWIQDEDVLDTWFSSSLWPFVGIGWKQNPELFKKFYPTDVLVTGYDILFFWVSRMMFQGLEFTNQMPFNNVLIHGLIRDSQGQKMSKSLNNGIDPMEVIEKYGADTLRYFLVTNSTLGQDLRYSEVKLESAWNFINKLWNAARFVIISVDDKFVLDKNFIVDYLSQRNELSDWILHELLIVKSQFMKAFDRYDFALAGKLITDFVWDKYCSWFIEFTKANKKFAIYNQKVINQTLIFVLKEILMLLHPYIPFATEEIYQCLDLKKSILLEQIEIYSFPFTEHKLINNTIKIISALREIRTQYNIPWKKAINYSLLKISNIFNNSELIIINNFTLALVNAKLELNIKSAEQDILIPLNDFVLEIKNDNLINHQTEITRLKETLTELTNEIIRSKNILANENFINKAKPEKVILEQEKLVNYQREYEEIQTKLKLWTKEKQ